MGQVDAAFVDVADVLHIAGEYDAIAEMVETAARTRLSRVGFGGTVAGRAHARQGDAVQGAVDDLADALRRWSSATRQTAAVLRATGDRYVAADANASDRVG